MEEEESEGIEGLEDIIEWISLSLQRELRLKCPNCANNLRIPISAIVGPPPITRPDTPIRPEEEPEEEPEDEPEDEE